MRPAASTRFALALLILGAIMISYSGVFVKLSEVGPQTTGFYRMFLPIPVLGLWMFLDKRQPEEKKTPLKGKMLLSVMGAGFFLALDLIAWHWSLKRIPVGAATLLGNTAPFWVALTGYFFLGEKFTFRFVLGMIVAFVGAVILVAGGSKAITGGEYSGYLLGLLAGMGYGGYLRCVSQARGQLSNTRVMFYSSVFASLTLLPVMLFVETQYWPLHWEGWAVLFGLAYMSQILGQGLIGWAMGHLSAAFSAISLLINPLAAGVFAWVTLGETLSLLQIAGGVSVLAGIFLARKTSQRSRREVKNSMEEI